MLARVSQPFPLGGEPKRLYELDSMHAGEAATLLHAFTVCWLGVAQALLSLESENQPTIRRCHQEVLFSWSFSGLIDKTPAKML